MATNRLTTQELTQRRLAMLEILTMPFVHRWAEATLHAERIATDEEFTQAYGLASSARRAMAQLKRHGWTVTYQAVPPCECGVPNRYHT